MEKLQTAELPQGSPFHRAFLAQLQEAPRLERFQALNFQPFFIAHDRGAGWDVKKQCQKRKEK